MLHYFKQNKLKVSKTKQQENKRVTTVFEALIRRWIAKTDVSFHVSALTSPACTKTRCWEWQKQEKRERLTPPFTSLSSVCFKRAYETDQRVFGAQIYRLRPF
jgi:hypothetical protein